jgi:hypothetical protein
MTILKALNDKSLKATLTSLKSPLTSIKVLNDWRKALKHWNDYCKIAL